MNSIEQKSRDYTEKLVKFISDTPNVGEMSEMIQKSYVAGFNDAIVLAVKFFTEGITNYPWYDFNIGDFSVEDITKDIIHFINNTQ